MNAVTRRGAYLFGLLVYQLCCISAMKITTIKAEA